MANMGFEVDLYSIDF